MVERPRWSLPRSKKNLGGGEETGQQLGDDLVWWRDLTSLASRDLPGGTVIEPSHAQSHLRGEVVL